MKKTRFLITSLLAAGIGVGDKAFAAPPDTPTTGDGDPNRQGLFRQFRLDHMVQLASHRSHSSHSSHRSSSSGGGYSYPSTVYTPPVYTPAPAPAPAPAPEPASPPSLYTPRRPSASRPQDETFATVPRSQSALPTLSGRTERFNSIVRRVQLGLLAYGYYQGPINGTVGEGTRAAIKRLQDDFKLKVTGTITPQVLDALRVTAE